MFRDDMFRDGMVEMNNEVEDVVLYDSLDNKEEDKNTEILYLDMEMIENARRMIREGNEDGHEE